MGDLIKAWLFWHLPRLWMNRTAYAFWVIEQRQQLPRRIRDEATRPAKENEGHG